MNMSILKDLFSRLPMLSGSTQTLRNYSPASNQTDQSSIELILSEVDMWLSVSLSIISCFFIISFTVIHVVVHIESRDHAKESKKFAFKKLMRNEYLVLSYCLSLLASHVLNILHKFLTKFYFFALVFDVKNESNGTTPSYAATTSHHMALATTTLSDGQQSNSTTTACNATDSYSSSSRSIANSYCLLLGTLKQYFWLLSMLHSNALSFKIYFKLTKSDNGNLLSKKHCCLNAMKTFSYTYGLSGLIVIVSVCTQLLGSDAVYNFKFADLMGSCFLSEPIYSICFFALPIMVILGVNFVLFIILFIKTKKTIEEAENHEMSKLFPKMGIVMGFSWIVYIVTTAIFEIFYAFFYIKIFVVVGSCQINLQGTIVVFGLFSNAVHEKIFKKKKSKNSKESNKPTPQQQQQQYQLQLQQLQYQIHQHQLQQLQQLQQLHKQQQNSINGTNTNTNTVHCVNKITAF